MEIHQQPSILKEASGANPKINFLVGCLQYDKSSRPSIHVLAKNLNHALHSSKYYQVITFHFIAILLIYDIKDISRNNCHFYFS